jgi:hypothetical protein
VACSVEAFSQVQDLHNVASMEPVEVMAYRLDVLDRTEPQNLDRSDQWAHLP